MNFLIICSYYPPDSAISAVRPYMFAKYLSQSGNKVTVLSSGAFNSTPDESYEKLDGVRTISFLGEQCDAELFAKGQYHAPSKQENKTHKNGFVKEIARSAYHFISEPFYAKKRLEKARSCFEQQKKTIDSLDESFDIILSTYSELENVFAGEYAARHFHAKWIMDFRDSIVDHINHERFVWNHYAKTYQIFALRNADLCITVSNGLRDEMKEMLPVAKIETLYNGFEADGVTTAATNQEKRLTICYTGQIYDLRLSALKHVVEAIRQLIEAKRIKRKDISFVYAGRNSAMVQKMFSDYQLNDVLEDHGQVSRSEAFELQDKSDVFLVLSWNTKTAKGILTGKFYEGIRAKKPIISIIEGDVPNSELKSLYEEYRYGFCYEACDQSTTINDLADYLCHLCTEKTSTGILSYTQDSELEEAFEYKKIVKRLNDLAQQLYEKA